MKEKGGKNTTGHILSCEFETASRNESLCNDIRSSFFFFFQLHMSATA